MSRVCLTCGTPFVAKGKHHAYCSRKCVQKVCNDRFRLVRPDYHRQKTIELRRSVFAIYGSSCVCCGESRQQFLAIDHIGGGGNRHRKELQANGQSAHMHRWLKKSGFPGGFRTLCHNCNVAIGIHGKCPHQYEPAAMYGPQDGERFVNE